MPSPDAIIPQKVGKWQLREIWNNPPFQQELLRRTTERVLVTERLAPPDSGQVKGAMSEVYDLFDNRTDELLATFHRYKNPDGSIGASGLPDPIILLVNGVPTTDP